MNRRKFLQSAATFGLALAAPPSIARAAAKELLVAEPVHSTGYLPMYIAMAKDYFAESGITVKIVTIETGSGHTNAVLSGQAFAFIGGPEHNAFAKLRGAELRAVANVVNRGNVYLIAAKGVEPKPGQDWPSYMKGKTIGTGLFSGTPNSIAGRYRSSTKQSSPSRNSNSLTIAPKSSGKTRPECGESRTSGTTGRRGPSMRSTFAVMGASGYPPWWQTASMLLPSGSIANAP